MRACHITAAPEWRTGQGNWGDKALVYATQKVFEESLGGIEWLEMDARRIYDEFDIAIINKYDFLIIGGGGLILPDTFENEVSGWQWGISKELIEMIDVPIIVYGIGWNLFEGQKNNDLVLRPNLEALADKASFISLRHSEDVNIFNEYVSNVVACLNYCPSIVMDDFNENRSKLVGINVACDRMDHRYNDYEAVFESLLEVIDDLDYRGYEPIIVNHMPIDAPFGEFIQSRRTIDIADMSRMSVGEGLSFYKSLGFMYATRGHAQMIPIGLGVKCASLVSHPKLSRFLHDIDMTDTGIDVNSLSFTADCKYMLGYLKNRDFRPARKLVERNIKHNMEMIKGLFDA